MVKRNWELPASELQLSAIVPVMLGDTAAFKLGWGRGRFQPRRAAKWQGRMWLVANQTRKTPRCVMEMDLALIKVS